MSDDLRVMWNVHSHDTNGRQEWLRVFRLSQAPEVWFDEGHRGGAMEGVGNEVRERADNGGGWSER